MDTILETPKISEEQAQEKLEQAKKAFFADENGTLHAAITMHDMGCLLTTHLMRRMFAIVDAAIADEQPRQAAKELIKHTLWDAHGATRQWMIDRAHGLHAEFPYVDSRTAE